MKIAIVGAGQIADAHLGEIARIENASVVALCDLNESPLQALQDKYRIPSVYTDFARLLQEAQPDVVHITTPPATHFMLAKQSIAAGAHVYIEKPLTVTYAETQALLRFAEQHSRKVCIGTNHIYSRAQKKAMAAIRNGEIGSITHIDSLFSYDLQGIFGRQIMSNPDHWIARLPGQVFQNNLNHPLTPIVPFLSDDFSVRAWADDWTGNGIVFEELRVEIIDHTNKLTAYIVFSSNVKPAAFRITYLGRKKALYLNNYNHTYLEDAVPRLPGTLGQILAIRQTMKSLSRQFWRALTDFFLGRETYFTDMKELFEKFYLAAEGKGPLPISVEELHKASRIMDEVVNQIGRPGGKK